MKIEQFYTGIFGVNSYVVSDEETKKAFMVDPGGLDQKMTHYIEENKLKIEFILLTHGHADHIDGVASYANLYKAQVVANIEEKDILEDNMKEMEQEISAMKERLAQLKDQK